MKQREELEQTLLAVDDSVETLLIVEHTLKKAGFKVMTASSGEQAMELVAEQGLPHLAVIDINMPPGMDGFELCRRLFRFSDLPVIMLTAVDEEKTVVNAIRQYAEDYVIKPFNPVELVARTKRVLGRVGSFPYPAAVPVAVDGHLEVDFAGRKIRVDDERASLTPTEARLLYILMRDAGETVASEYVLNRMWPLETTYEERLHVYVHRLRNKLQKVSTEHEYVVSERGIGYRFQPQSGQNSHGPESGEPAGG